MFNNQFHFLKKPLFWVLIMAYCIIENLGHAQSANTLPSLEAFESSSSNYNDIGKIDSALVLTKKYVENTQFEEAIKFADWCLTESEKSEYTKGKAEVYILLSSIAVKLNQYGLLVEWTMKAKELLENNNYSDEQLKSKIYQNLAAGYSYLEKYNLAKEAYLKGIALAQQNENTKEQASRLMGLGNVYYYLDVYDSAYTCYKNAEALYLKHDPNFNNAFVMGSMGNVFDAKKDFETAKIYYTNALNGYRQSNNQFGVTWMQNNLSNTLLSLGLIEQSQSFLDSASEKAKKYEYHVWQPHILENQVKIHERKGAFEMALTVQKKLQSLKDSLNQAETIKELSKINSLDIESKFEALRLRNQIHLAEAERQKTITNLVVLCFVFAITTLVVLAISFKKNIKQNALLKEQNASIISTNQELQHTQIDLHNAHAKLSRLNANLESEVEKRTEEIVRQNQIITDYANINAHKLRGVLARYIGLINLFEMSETIEEKEEYIYLISQLSNQFEEVIKEISQVLENDFALKLKFEEIKRNK